MYGPWTEVHRFAFTANNFGEEGGAHHPLVEHRQLVGVPRQWSEREHRSAGELTVFGLGELHHTKSLHAPGLHWRFGGLIVCFDELRQDVWVVAHRRILEDRDADFREWWVFGGLDHDMRDGRIRRELVLRDRDAPGKDGRRA